MAKLTGFDEEEITAWLATRPPTIQEMHRKHPAGRLYRMASTGHRVTIYSYSEGGTVTVDITGEYNLLDFERRVFGINPSELTECDLPVPGESLGATLTYEQAGEFLAAEKLKRETAN